MPPRLSVNINKVALIRNARGGNVPNLLEIARHCESSGAQGITVHPRPDERHIRYRDVRELRAQLSTELNVEGNPQPAFMRLMKEVKPHQVTLVPDAPGALTSDAGWDTYRHAGWLKEVVEELHQWGCRVAIFVDADTRMVEGAAEIGADRVELFTGPYAARFDRPDAALKPYVEAAQAAIRTGLAVNAGHDLNRHNLSPLVDQLPRLDEVSIGQALISDALYFGLQNTIQMYLRALEEPVSST